MIAMDAGQLVLAWQTKMGVSDIMLLNGRGQAVGSHLTSLKVWTLAALDPTPRQSGRVRKGSGCV